MNCARGCTAFRRHLAACPVEDRKSGAWVTIPMDDERREWIREDTPDDMLAMLNLNRNRWGGLEEWVECRGCLPRPAEHGTLCEQCHIRLSGWLAGSVHAGRWIPAEASIAWGYDWLAADREPRQAAAGLDKIMQGKKVPPAALALHVHDLRRDMTMKLGIWLRHVTQEFHLTGPDWWAYRVNRRAWSARSWRAFMPQDQREVTDAQRFLHGWLPRIEGAPDLVSLVYTDAENLMVRVASLAPWQAKPRKLTGIECPECDRPALALFEGSSEVTCGRCSAVYDQKRFGIWTAVLENESA